MIEEAEGTRNHESLSADANGGEWWEEQKEREAPRGPPFVQIKLSVTFFGPGLNHQHVGAVGAERFRGAGNHKTSVRGLNDRFGNVPFGSAVILFPAQLSGHVDQRQIDIRLGFRSGTRVTGDHKVTV